MEEKLYLVKVPQAFLYGEPGGPADAQGIGAQTDEVLSGWGVRALGDSAEAWVRIETHYGYEGWMRMDALRALDLDELIARQDRERFQAVGENWMDLHEEPKVQGRLLTTLPRGSFVERTGETAEKEWIKVRDAAGTEGWARTKNLRQRMDGDGYLIEGNGDKTWLRRHGEAQIREADEKALRTAAVGSALSWMGTPYRWGGKSPAGIDCSGLAFMSWMENGILIYRDASIKPEYPLRKIEREALKEGDLVFFPGHVAVYLGKGKYVHATANEKAPRVTINSLNPADPDYREDLDKSVEECGSLFQF